EDLRTFNDQHPAPSDRKTPAQLEADLVHQLQKALDTLAPGENPVAWEAARDLLATALRVRVGVVNPPPAELVQNEVRRLSRNGLTIVHSTVGRKESDTRIPVVRLIPTHASGRLTVITTSHGKERLIGDDGNISPLLKALLGRGQSVVGFDPLMIGESV